MTPPGLRAYRHESAGFQVSLPAHWESLTDVRDGVPLISVEPDQGLGFRANLVVTTEPLPEGLTLQRWQERADEIMTRVMEQYLLLDRQYFLPGGRPTLHRLTHHADEHDNAVTTEQWATVGGSTGYTLTASVHSLAFDGLADLFSEVAAGFAPLDRRSGSPDVS